MITNYFSFKNRIAFYYIMSTALLVLVVFVTIHYTVSKSVYKHLDNDINEEVRKLYNYIEVSKDKIVLINQKEWQEEEHTTKEVNPIFVEFLDLEGTVFDKSPNLKNSQLQYGMYVKENQIFNAQLNDKAVRQIKIPLYYQNKKTGYMQVAVSVESASYILKVLDNILLISFPIILAILFITARFFAGKSIKPIENVIQTSNLISKDNLSARITLPQNKDEIYILSQTINNLLNRIEDTIEREKQFTSDASHELRTPLAVVKGTLEVLVRKPRNTEEYNEKINYCITEINRINSLVDQLLLLARLENQKQSLKINPVSLNTVISESLARFNQKIISKNIKIEENYTDDFIVETDAYFLSIIVNNLISNALKYSTENQKVTLSITTTENNKTVLQITDNGIGIPKDELNKIFNSFYRTSHSTEMANTKGTGLGLSIVKRLCTILNIDIKVYSKLNQETRFSLYF